MEPGARSRLVTVGQERSELRSAYSQLAHSALRWTSGMLVRSRLSSDEQESAATRDGEQVHRLWGEAGRLVSVLSASDGEFQWDLLPNQPPQLFR